MLHVTPYGFCIACNKPYETGSTAHYKDFHDGKYVTDAPDGWKFTPEYLAWKQEHEDQSKKDLRTIIRMLESGITNEDIVLFIRQEFLEEMPKTILP